ncbi:MAG: hypothetical protein ACODAB_09790 [Gemmatimonadota bacterium]
MSGCVTATGDDVDACRDRLDSVRAGLRSARYLDELCRMRCAPTLLDPELDLWPNAKEITESFAAFEAARRHLHHWIRLPALCVVVGDGARPRTAATFAVRTPWHVLSVDPALRAKTAYDKIRRLEVIPRRVEDVEVRRFGTPWRVVVVAVHSHAPLEAALDKFQGRTRSVVAMPCCRPQRVGREPDAEYRDPGVWSPHNVVRIWKGA